MDRGIHSGRVCNLLVKRQLLFIEILACCFMLRLSRFKRFDALFGSGNLPQQILCSITQFTQFGQVKSRNCIFLSLYLCFFLLKSILSVLGILLSFLKHRSELFCQFLVLSLYICQALLDCLTSLIDGVQMTNDCLSILINTDFFSFGRDKCLNLFYFSLYLANFILSIFLST